MRAVPLLALVTVGVTAGSTAGCAPVTAARNTASPPAFSITAPDGGPWGPLVLAVVEQSAAQPAIGNWCPDDEAADAVCVGQPQMESAARIIGYLSDRPAGWREPQRTVRLRFATPRGGHDAPAGRRIAVLEQSGSDYLWQAWSAPVERGWACIDAGVAERFSISADIVLRPRGTEQRCFRLSQLR